MKFNLLRWFGILILSSLSPGIVYAAGDPEPGPVLEAMKKAVAFYRDKLAVHGGYASAWKKDLSEGQVEHSASKTVISIQPHGTTTVGLALVEAYRATGEKLFFTAANEAANSLIECQLESGGWPSDFDFAPDKAAKYYLRSDKEEKNEEQGKRRNLSTLDDNKTQSALRFLVELASLPESKENGDLHSCLEYAMEKLFAAQAPNGAFPQQWDVALDDNLPVKKASYPDSWSREYPKEQYHRYYTLNDNNLLNAVEMLLRARDLTGEDRYLERAKKVGDFLLLAQMPDPQPAWAQQYNFETQPVWARKFEPPSLSSGESFGAIETLFQLWVVSGDEKYRAPLARALDWLEKSALPDGTWARFYELKTNRPLYCEADTYKVTYDGSNTPSHYGFNIGNLSGKIERMRENLARDREDLLRKRNSEPSSKESWEKRARDLRGKVKQALKEQEPDGYWLRGDLIDAGEFVKHIRTMASYVEASRKSSAE